ncbi:MAG: DUF4445 domain-containing protein [Actinobacteria bacterium]|nr:DUF4445 domain-containing protein [Actinomycetota bacterium]
MEHRVTVKPLGNEVACREGQALLEALREAGIGVESVCGGRGTCGKCRIRVLSGDAGSPTADELERLRRERAGDGLRLACQVVPRGDLTIFIPASSLTGNQRLQLESGLGSRDFDPAVRAYDLEVEIPGEPGDAGSDLLRLREALLRAGPLAEPRAIDIEALRALPGTLREEEGSVRAVLRGEAILGIIPRKRTPLGLAVDLGSTKIALFLYDLESGEMLSAHGLLNPQIPYGEDIVTRIQQALEGKDGRLQALAAEGITEGLSAMLAETGREKADVFEAVVVGNTAMHHLFLGLPVEQLARSPYLPATDQPHEVAARDLGLRLNPSAVVYLPPPIAGYVGSDHLAAVYAARMEERTGPCLLLDIGTNTEVALQVEGRVRCCSCASGPAFEGGGLSCGMRASEGAVEAVLLDPDTGEPELSVIGGTPPRGICGSGVLSALAALLRSGTADPGGRLLEGMPGVERGTEGLFFPLTQDTDEGTSLAVTQGDIREIQKAKGAMRAGIDALLAEEGLDPGDLEEVIMAGAFGTYVDPADALAIALLPPVPLRIITQVGNAAGSGARSMLLSIKARREAEALAERIEYLELSAYPRLGPLFAADMYLTEEAVAAAKGRFALGRKEG